MLVYVSFDEFVTYSGQSEKNSDTRIEWRDYITIWKIFFSRMDT